MNLRILNLGIAFLGEKIVNKLESRFFCQWEKQAQNSITSGAPVESSAFSVLNFADVFRIFEQALNFSC